MVQRKEVNNSKFRIQNLYSNRDEMALKSCSKQDPDGRNKCGVEITKKMKKSRSFKSVDFESCLRSPTRRDEFRFKKPTSASATQKKASPNYMKPTSCSDARRESMQLQLQVSLRSQTPSKSKSSPRNSNRSRPSPASALKSMKVLVRKSSFKPARPSMKKSCGAALQPQLDLNRATCSSTLKESKFPPYVELEPGGTESEGLSVMKVCPYTYCSLNGHHRSPSPPLKRFLSARRHLLKTQKSMKLKGLSATRIRSSGDGSKEIDTGQMVFDEAPVVLESESFVSPVIEEVYSDFFVEIFAKPREEIAGSGEYGDSRRISDGDDHPELDFAETPEVVKEESSGGDGEMPPPASSESTEADVEEVDADSESQFNEQNEENLGQKMDDSMKFAEDNEFDQEGHQEMNNLNFSIHDQEEIGFEFCMENNAGKEVEIWGEMDEDASDSVSMDMDWEEETHFDNGIDCSMFSDDGSIPLQGNEDPHERACDSDDSDVEGEEKSEETFILQGYDDAEGRAAVFDDGAYECNSVELDGENENLEINEVPDVPEDICVLKDEKSDCDIQIEIINSGNSNGVSAHPTEAGIKNINAEGENDLLHKIPSFNHDTEESPIETDKAALSEGHSSGRQQTGTISESPELTVLDESGLLECETSETVESEMGHLALAISYIQEGVPQSSDDGETKDGDEFNGSVKVQNSESSETDQEIAHEDRNLQPDMQHIDESEDSGKDHGNLGCHYISKSTCSEEGSDAVRYGSSSPEDCTKTDEKMQLEDDVMVCTEEPIVAAVGIKIPEEKETADAGTNARMPLPETYNNRIGKHRRLGKRRMEDSEQLKKFSPRAPRFLDPEPDPEAEKVDLRHQLMDERKNAEEWMIDHALQQAVNKLAPARKRRVALLVEAFETVAPLPKCEAHLRHSAPSFTHARPIQACS